MGSYICYFIKIFNGSKYFPFCAVSYCWWPTSRDKWWRMIRHERRVGGEEIVWFGQLSQLPNYLLYTKPGSSLTCFTSLASVRTRGFVHACDSVRTSTSPLVAWAVQYQELTLFHEVRWRGWYVLRFFFWVVACSGLNPMECILDRTSRKSLSISGRGAVLSRPSRRFGLLDYWQAYSLQYCDIPAESWDSRSRKDGLC